MLQIVEDRANAFKENNSSTNKKSRQSNHSKLKSSLNDEEELDDDFLSENDSHALKNVLSVSTVADADYLNELDPLVKINLPDSWASLDFERKKSCILSNIYSTCVTKAINHLELIQNAIDKWYIFASNSF